MHEFGYNLALVEPHHPMFAKPFPDYWCRRISDGQMDRIELELFPSCFIEHKHDINKVDYIYCADDDRPFFPGFPKEISDKIIITNTRAYKAQRCMKALEERCEKAIKEKNFDKLILALGWTGKDNECMICGKYVHNRITNEMKLFHTKCAKVVIDAYKKDSLTSIILS